MAGAYGTIATGGVKHEAVAIQSITNYKGDTIFEADTTGERVISEEVAKAAEKVMEGVITYGTGTAAALPNGQVAAGKTGTSEEWRDSWFCGITPQYSVAIWLGCRQERTMNEAFTATSVFSSFVGTMLQGQATKDFPMASALDPTYRTLTSEETTKLGASSWNYSYSYDYGYNYTPTYEYDTYDDSSSGTTDNGNSSGTSGDGTGASTVTPDDSGDYDDGATFPDTSPGVSTNGSSTATTG